MSAAQICALASLALAPLCAGAIRLSAVAPPRCALQLSSSSIICAPTAAERARLHDIHPSSKLTPRDVISAVMAALHRSSWDEPRPYFGFEVLGRFLSPSHQYPRELARRNQKQTPQSLSRYLRQPHKAPLLAWNEYRWEGELLLLGEREAYQQISVRGEPDGEWTSVRWVLTRPAVADAPEEVADEWMVDAVFVSEPDNTPGVAEAPPEVTTASYFKTTADETLAAAWDAGDDAWAAVLTASPLDTPLGADEQRRLFDAFDLDGSGEISRVEFIQVVENLGLHISRDELSAILRAADTDNSGQISFDEFSQLLDKAVDGSATAVGRFAGEVGKVMRDMYEQSPRRVVETVMKA